MNYGIHGANGNRSTQHSFYQVHWYVYPVIYWLQLIVDFLCLEKADFDVGYLTEFDPLWNEDELSFILNPEAVLFGNPIAQAACAADCTAASTGFPQDILFLSLEVLMLFGNHLQKSLPLQNVPQEHQGFLAFGLDYLYFRLLPNNTQAFLGFF